VNPAREALLWASQHRWLREHLPRYGFVRASVARFMPGETVEEALDAAERLAADGIHATFTNLGENVADLEAADAVAEHYLDLLGRIEARGINAEISVKPTHLGLELDGDRTLGHLRRLATRSADLGRHLWIDMESSEYVEPTIDLAKRLRVEHANTGVCIQAYLRRTPQDVADLLAIDASIRLVKGAYREPRELALDDRAAVSTVFRKLALEIIGRPHEPESRLALATHDVDLLGEIERDAAAKGVGRDAYEIQMLYGIRVADQRRLAREGYRVRVLIAYGTYWYPWFMRRLAERPANVWFAVRNLLTGG
jgi:proline dehydrogenase